MLEDGPGATRLLTKRRFPLAGDLPNELAISKIRWDFSVTRRSSTKTQHAEASLTQNTPKH